MKQIRRDTVRQLQADRRLKGKCCHCDEVFPLADALLFYADRPPPLHSAYPAGDGSSGTLRSIPARSRRLRCFSANRSQS